MRYVLLGVILAMSVAQPVRADGGLTVAVAATWGSRTVDGALHTIAHQRVIEISACDGCLNHDRMRPGTAEVLGFNSGYADPISSVIGGWRSSPTHNAILSDRSLGRIGCAEAIVGAGHYFVCVLAAGGGAGGGSTYSTGTVARLPDTALH
ncbi:MAG: hypothetical protein ACRDHD_08115 [Candidatus Limnocylindria bacterium]